MILKGSWELPQNYQESGWVKWKRRFLGRWLNGGGCVCILFMVVTVSAEAIIRDPSSLQIDEAIKRGEMLAEKRQPPVTLYTSFGTSSNLMPHGFLMTKLGGVAVMAGHFALRGERPSHQEIERILSEEELQVVVTVFGDSPFFARNSYLLLKQGDNLIVPTRIRADGRAVPVGPLDTEPVFRAKIVASFPYGSFAPDAETVVSVFPGVGGEVDFVLDFSKIP